MSNCKEIIKKFYFKFNVFAMLVVAALYFGKLWLYRATCRINTDYHIINMKIDELIPLCKYFAFFYFTYYWFSTLQLWIISFFDKKKFYRLIIAIAVACIISNIIFLCYQVKMIRPEVVGDNFFSRWVRWIYRRDPRALNCFPSIHAVVGVAMIIGGWKTGKMPKWLTIVSIIFGVGCILSTVFVKQHYFIDMVAGTILFIIVYPLVIYFEKLILKRKEQKNKI